MAGVTAVGHVGLQQLEDHALRMPGALAVRAHLHTRGREAAAGRCQYALTIDFDHTGTAVAVRAQIVRIAQMRYLHGMSPCRLQDSFTGLCLDIHAIQVEADASRLCVSCVVHVSLPRKVLQGAQQRIGCGLAESADGGVHHGPGKLFQQRLVPVRLLHQLQRLDGTGSARRALATGLVGKEPHGVARGTLHIVVLRQDDDSGGTDKTAVVVEGVKVQRNVVQRGRQDAARGTTGKIGLQFMAGKHPATVFIDQLAQRDARGCQLNARFVDAPADREAAQPLAAVTAVRGEPLGSLLENPAHPVEGFHVVFQRWPSEQADLGHEGRAQARHAALAFDGLDHGRFFPADIGPGAAAQVDGRVRQARVAVKGGQFPLQQLAAARIFIAQIDVDFTDVDHVGGDQDTFEEPVRVAFQVVAVLECAGFALVDIDRHQPRAVHATNDVPFATGREPGPAQSAQTRVFQGCDDIFRQGCDDIRRIPLSGQQGPIDRVTASAAVVFQLNAFRYGRLGVAVLHQCGYRVRLSLVHRVGADHRHRGSIAAAHTGDPLHAYPGPQVLFK